MGKSNPDLNWRTEEELTETMEVMDDIMDKIKAGDPEGAVAVVKELDSTIVRTKQVGAVTF